MTDKKIDPDSIICRVFVAPCKDLSVPMKSVVVEELVLIEFSKCSFAVVYRKDNIVDINKVIVGSPRDGYISILNDSILFFETKCFEDYASFSEALNECKFCVRLSLRLECFKKDIYFAGVYSHTNVRHKREINTSLKSLQHEQTIKVGDQRMSCIFCKQTDINSLIEHPTVPRRISGDAVLFCTKCFDSWKYYRDIAINDNDLKPDGQHEDLCYVCSSTPEYLTLCSKCDKSFCDYCLHALLSKAELKRMEQDEDWACVCCQIGSLGPPESPANKIPSADFTEVSKSKLLVPSTQNKEGQELKLVAVTKQPAQRKRKGGSAEYTHPSLCSDNGGGLGFKLSASPSTSILKDKRQRVSSMSPSPSARKRTSDRDNVPPETASLMTGSDISTNASGTDLNPSMDLDLDLDLDEGHSSASTSGQEDSSVAVVVPVRPVRMSAAKRSRRENSVSRGSDGCPFCIYCGNSPPRPTRPSYAPLVVHPSVPTTIKGRPVYLCQRCLAAYRYYREEAANCGELVPEGQKNEEICCVCSETPNELTICSAANCRRSYCELCLRSLFSREDLKKMESMEDWMCVPCSLGGRGRPPGHVE